MTELTPAQILDELRDIHLPPGAEMQPEAIAFEPFWVLAILLLGVGVLRWRRRHRWRRMARLELARIGRVRSEPERWAALLQLLHRIAPHRRRGDGSAPECVFLPPERIGGGEIGALHEHLQRMTGR